MASVKKGFLIVLLAASLVFSSGCIEFGGGSEEETGQGLKITSFESIPSEVFSGDSFDLLLDVKNVGGVTAEDVQAEITQKSGATEGDLDTTTTINLDPPSQDFEGEMHTFDAEMNAPEISVGPENLDIKSRVYYKYNTNARVLLPVMMKDEYKERSRAGDEIPSMGVSRVSDGPFSVSIDGASPTLVEDKSGAKDFRFYIEGKNKGKGVPYHTDGHASPDSDDLHDINVSIDLPDNVDWINDEDCSGDVTVRDGDDFQVICEANYTGDSDFEEIPIDVDLDYGYYIDDQTSVKVQEEI
ncbi:MAG: hypothetical protein ACLFQ8_00025 [Candidatus Aenigmatarchaeota archaeon]